jgi:hypothetical protein
MEQFLTSKEPELDRYFPGPHREQLEEPALD